MIKVLEIPVRENLVSFSGYLSAQGVKHRLSEDGLNQVLWVDSEAAATFVLLAFEKYKSGELEVQRVANSHSILLSFASGFRRYPFTLSLIVINILLLPLGMSSNQLDSNTLFARLMLLEIEQVGAEFYFVPLQQTLKEEQWWRLLTPMFIHFSWLHIVFNLLWVWEIGRRVEIINGAFAMLCLVVFASISANLLQLLIGGPSFFGGMSGVVFGLLGYSMVWTRLVPERGMGVAKGIYVFMLIYLAVGFTGAIDALGFGKLANGAHLGGLLAGFVTGGLAALFYRFRLQDRLR